MNLKKKRKKRTTSVYQIIINREAPEETRVALLEKGRLEAFDVETQSHVQTRGNLYKGRLMNVENSLQAAFIDIGLNRNAYLPFKEIHPEYYEYAENSRRLSSFLKKGQEFLVQIVKEETLQKGAAVSTYLSIPGRYLVLMPGSDQVGVSRKIEDESERKRLRDILKSTKVPQGCGMIARTASRGIPKSQILKDQRYLTRLWRDLRKKVNSAKAPALIYRDQDLVIRFLRDNLTPDVKEIIVDRQEIYDQIRSFLRIIAPRQVAMVRLYKKEEPIFSHFRLESQIDQIYQPRVYLPSGGHIVIEPTEALVSVDVNSGSYVKEKDLEETAKKINLEAAEEIARQLRLRDLGGIIVVDFIDMRHRANQRAVERKMRECLKKDRARSEISTISRFGLMELVRQKIRSPIQLGSYQPCSCCEGRGSVRSVETLALAYLRNIRSKLAGLQDDRVEYLVLEVPPRVVSYIQNKKRLELSALEQRSKVGIRIEPNSDLSMEEFNLYLEPGKS